MATTNDLKNGMTLDIEGQLWNVVEFQHVKPGKGPAFVRTKLKNVLSGKVVERTFNAGVKVDVAILEKREMQFLYKDPSGYVFMDSSTYDQMTISPETVGDAANYMLENSEAIVAVHEGNPLYVELPANVPLRITYTEPAYKEIDPQLVPSPQLSRLESPFRFHYLSSKMKLFLLIPVRVSI